MMKRLLIAESDRFSTEALRRLAPFLDVQTCGTARTDLERAIASADILWVRLRHFIDAPLLDCAPNLRVIVTATTGLNHIDMKAASARGIAVLSLRGEPAPAVDFETRQTLHWPAETQRITIHRGGGFRRT